MTTSQTTTFDPTTSPVYIYSLELQNTLKTKGTQKKFNFYKNKYLDLYQKNEILFKQLYDRNGVYDNDIVKKMREEEIEIIENNFNERCIFVKKRMYAMKRQISLDIEEGISIKNNIILYLNAFPRLHEEFINIFENVFKGGPDFDIETFMLKITHKNAHSTEDKELYLMMRKMKHDLRNNPDFDVHILQNKYSQLYAEDQGVFDAIISTKGELDLSPAINKNRLNIRQLFGLYTKKEASILQDFFIADHFQ